MYHYGTDLDLPKSRKDCPIYREYEKPVHILFDRYK